MFITEGTTNKDIIIFETIYTVKPADEAPSEESDKKQKKKKSS